MQQDDEFSVMVKKVADICSFATTKQIENDLKITNNIEKTITNLLDNTSVDTSLLGDMSPIKSSQNKPIEEPPHKVIVIPDDDEEDEAVTTQAINNNNTATISNTNVKTEVNSEVENDDSRLIVDWNDIPSESELNQDKADDDDEEEEDILQRKRRIGRKNNSNKSAKRTKTMNTSTSNKEEQRLAAQEAKKAKQAAAEQARISKQKSRMIEKSKKKSKQEAHAEIKIVLDAKFINTATGTKFHSKLFSKLTGSKVKMGDIATNKHKNSVTFQRTTHTNPTTDVTLLSLRELKKLLQDNHVPFNTNSSKSELQQLAIDRNLKPHSNNQTSNDNENDKTITEEKYVILLLTAQEIAEILTISGKNREFADEIAVTWHGYQITIVIFALGSFMRTLASPAQRNRYFTNIDDPNKKAEMQAEDIESFLIWLQIERGIHIRDYATMEEIVEFVVYKAEAIGYKPYKPPEKFINFCADSVAVKRKLSKEPIQTWENQLVQIIGVSDAVAKAIVTSYPSPKLLFRAYTNSNINEAAKKMLLANLVVISDTSDNRTIGYSLSEKIYRIFTSEDGSELIC